MTVSVPAWIVDSRSDRKRRFSKIHARVSSSVATVGTAVASLGKPDRVTGPADDIKGKIKDHIRQYVIDNSTAHDDSTWSYHEIFFANVAPGTGGLSRNQVNNLLDASGAWESLSGVEKKLVCKCLSPSIDDLGKAVLQDMTGADDQGITWEQFAAGSELAPLPEPPPPPDIEVHDPETGVTTTCPQVIVWGEWGLPDRVPEGVPPGTPLAGLSAGIMPYWYIPDPACAKPGLIFPMGPPGEIKPGGKFAGFTVAPRFVDAGVRTATTVAPPPPPPPETFADTLSLPVKVGVGLGVPAIAAGLAWLKWGWIGAAAGGGVGLVLVGGAYLLATHDSTAPDPGASTLPPLPPGRRLSPEK